jgi:uncharacterized Fe-S cluster-containing protein
MMDIPDQLRAACAAVRCKDYPLAELIPTMQLAADVIDALREQLADSRMREQELAETLMRAPARSGFVRVVDGKKVPQ